LSMAISTTPYNGDWVVDVYDDHFVFASGESYFTVEYTLADGKAQIVGVPQEVQRDVTYVPVTNHQEVDPMKEFIINALKAKGIKTDGLDDQALLAEYNKLQGNQTDVTVPGAPANQASDALVADALTKIASRLDAIEARTTTAIDTELNSLAQKVVDSGKYPGVDLDTAKKLGVNSLQTMVASITPAFGIPLTVVNSSATDKNSVASLEMPA